MTYWTQYLIGGLLGFSFGCLFYGGIGYLAFGTTGLILGLLVAAAFAAYGLYLVNPWRMPELFSDNS